jgi:hypothetical protein
MGNNDTALSLWIMVARWRRTIVTSVRRHGQYSLVLFLRTVV